MSSPGSGIDWPTVGAVIFDVDGTLFDHKALRVPILARMLARLATGHLTWRDVSTVRVFRQERTRLAIEEASDIGRLQFESVAAAMRRPRHEVEAVVTQWICREPLDFVARYAFPHASRFISALQERGVRIGVFSDYPAIDKLKVLGLSLEVVRDATDSDVGRLKPHPQGFIRVAELLNVSPNRCLVIGDRDDRDGEAARRGGFRFLKKVTRPQSKGPSFTSYQDLALEVARRHNV